MVATLSGRWIPSSKRHPCPICNRTTDGDCRISSDGLEVICHHPKDLRRGKDVINGWAFTGNSSDGRGGHFTVDTPKDGSGRQQPRKVLPLHPRTPKRVRQPAPITGPIALGRLPEPWPEEPEPHPSRASWNYSSTQQSRRTQDGKGGKVCRPWHMEGDDWAPGAGSRPWPLYREAEARAHCRGRFVLVAEGEPCTDWARAGGLVAVTPPGHAHKPEQLEPCFKRLQEAEAAGLVALLDNDAEGTRRGQQIADAAAEVGLPCLLLPAADVWPDLPPAGSIDDAPGTAAERAAALVAHLQNLQPDALEPITTAAVPEQSSNGKRRFMAPDEVLALIPERLGGTPRLNVRTGVVEVNDRTLSGDEIDRLFLHLSNAAERWPHDATALAVIDHAERNRFDPVADYLQELPGMVEPLPMEQWERLDLHLLGIDDPIAAAFLPQFLISAVARVFRPGCSVRRTPVLIGKQWRGKTRLGRIIFGADHWVENVSDLGRDDLLRLQAGWGVELSELNGITRRKDQEALKAFLTACDDVFRAPYGKGVKRCPRHSVFWGTSNGPPLRDLSGSTRFVCIPIPDRMLPLDWAAANRDAIWSRAMERFQQIPADQEPWDHATEGERQAIAERNASHEEIDPWADEVAGILDRARQALEVPVAVPVILDSMEIPKSQRNNATAARIRQLAEHLGWQWDRRRAPGARNPRQGLWPREAAAAVHPVHPVCTPRDSRPDANDAKESAPAVQPVHPDSTKKDNGIADRGEAMAAPQRPQNENQEVPTSGMNGVHITTNACDAKGSAVHGRGARRDAQPRPPWFEALVGLRRARPADAPYSLALELPGTVSGRAVAQWLPLVDQQLRNCADTAGAT